MTTPNGAQGTGQEPAQGGQAGTGQEPGTPQQGQGQEPAQQSGQTGESGAGTEPETFDRAYVERLRQEAAQYRTRAQTAEQQIQQAQQANMTEAERTAAELERLRQENQALVESQRTAALEATVTAEATRQGFVNPGLAVRLLDRTQVLDADGKPTGVKEALEAVLKENPYLARRASADTGGGGSSSGGKPSTMNDAIRAAAGRRVG